MTEPTEASKVNLLSKENFSRAFGKMQKSAAYNIIKRNVLRLARLLNALLLVIIAIIFAIAIGHFAVQNVPRLEEPIRKISLLAAFGFFIDPVVTILKGSNSIKEYVRDGGELAKANWLIDNIASLAKITFLVFVFTWVWNMEPIAPIEKQTIYLTQIPPKQSTIKTSEILRNPFIIILFKKGKLKDDQINELDPIGFELNNEYKRQIKYLSEAISACSPKNGKQAKIKIFGHASSATFKSNGKPVVNSNELNLKLAHYRAEIVAQELKKRLLIPDKNIVAVHYSNFSQMRQPFIDNSDKLPDYVNQERLNQSAFIMLENTGACHQLIASE